MQNDIQDFITDLFALSHIPCVQKLLQALACNGLGGHCPIGETTINEAVDYFADHHKSLIDSTCMSDEEKQEAKRKVDQQSEIVKTGIKTKFQKHQLLV